MKKISALFTLIFSLFFIHQSMAMLSLELTRGKAGAIPIAVVPFENAAEASQNVSTIISHDLQNSGRFKVHGGGGMSRSMPDSFYKALGVNDIVTGSVSAVGGDRYQVKFQLREVFKGAKQSIPLLSKTFTIAGLQLRPLAHHISDLIYQKMTGIPGVFSTKLAYIVVKNGKPTHYTLEVADQDGYNPRPLLSSLDPIMSPAWSPNGKQIAYVSFEHHHASIYLQDAYTGHRRLLTSFPGINGAPSWSPDGTRLALVLSKSGSPNIYLLDLNSHHLTQLTHDYYINTEPAWSPDGRNLIFTSDRSGSAQVYKFNLANHSISRVTYDGNYNARASYSPDGNHIIVLNRESGLYNIGVLDLDTGSFRVLTNSGSDNESPSIAPNSSMVLFGTVHHGRSVLGMVATDGSVEIRLPARNGEVQDPAWSPV